MEDIKLTILCITYNHASYIRKALDGYLMQKTDFKFEIIINDDASNDGTTDIIREYTNKYPEIIKPIFHEENQYSKGPNPAITYWVPNMNGKYIAVSEADDYWTDPNKLQIQVDFLDSHPDYIMCFHNAEVLSDKEEDRHMYDHLESREYKGIEIYKKWTIPTCSVVYRNELNIPLDVYKDVYFGDIFLFLNLSERGRIYCINKKMAVYRRAEGGVSFSLNYQKACRLIKQYEFSAKYFCANVELVQYSMYCILVYCWYIMYECQDVSCFQRISALYKANRIEKKRFLSRNNIFYVLNTIRKSWKRKLK